MMNRFNVLIQKMLWGGLGLAMALIILEVSAERMLKTSGLDQKLKHAEGRLRGDADLIGSYDAYLGWGYRPNTSEKHDTSEFHVVYSINANGFRDKEVPADMPPGEFRILGLGDSTTFGEGINYGGRFTEVIENSLDNVNVINMGVSGFGADQSLLQLERDGFRFKPRVVILFVSKEFCERCKLYQRLKLIKPRFVLNGPKDDMVLQDMNFIKDNFLNKMNMHPETPPHPTGGAANAPPPSFFEKSGLFTLWSSKKRLSEIQQKITDRDRSRWQGVYKQLEEDRRGVMAYNDNDFKTLIFLIVKRYQRICEENSADFILAYIDEDRGYFAKYLMKPCQDLGIKCIDLSDALLEASTRHPLRFNIDPHHNEFAHQVIGTHVADYLAKSYPETRKKTQGYIT